MHFDSTISLGAVVGWAITALSVAYALGKFTQVMANLGTTVSRLEAAHEAHCEDDMKRFTSVGEQLTNISTAVLTRR